MYRIAPSGQSLTCLAISVASRPDDSVRQSAPPRVRRRDRRALDIGEEHRHAVGCFDYAHGLRFARQGGIGLASDAVDRIFNEFTQASYETALRFGGSGLGLTITRRLLGLYGSSVQVKSVPGEGSTFSFDLRLPIPATAQNN